METLAVRSSAIVSNPPTFSHPLECIPRKLHHLGHFCTSRYLYHHGHVCASRKSRIQNQILKSRDLPQQLSGGIRVSWWGSRGDSSSSISSFLRSSHLHSNVARAAAKTPQDVAREVALGVLSTSEEQNSAKIAQEDDVSGTSSSGQTDSPLKNESNPSSFFNMEDGDMECIGTGTDVECVVPLRNFDSKVPGKVAGRAVNDNIDGRAFVEGREGKGEEITILGSVLDTLLLISPFFFWGTAMVAMKGLLPKAGPMFVAATRLIPAGALLIGFASSRGRKIPVGRSAWLAIALFGLIDASCFQGFLAEGLRRTSAGLGSVIIDSQPLTVAVLAAFLFGESLGPIAIVGLALGVVGLVLLEVPLEVLQTALVRPDGLQGLAPSATLQSAGVEQRSLWDSGEWWMLLAAQSMAGGTVMVRWVCQYCDPIMATGWHMVLGGIPLLALSVLQGDPAVSGHLQDLSLTDWGALFYTSLFGSAISYGVFFYNATRGSLTKLSSLTFLTPMFAAFFGYIVLDETLGGVQLLGAGVTLFSIYLVNKKVEAKTQDPE